jgi:membrane protein DedA with SNARE-associated domain
LDWLLPALQHINPLLLYLSVGAFLLLESCGIAIVNTSLLLFAGAVASFGHVNIILLALIAIIGSTAGACLAYLVGLRGGELALQRLMTRLHVDVQKIELAKRWFSRSGVRMIFLSRILPYVRPFACFFGGIAQMPFQRFLIAAMSGSIVWCVAILAVGWSLGRRWHLALYLIQSYTLPALAIIALAIAVYVLARLTINRRLKHRLRATHSEKSNAGGWQSDDLLEV